MEGALRDFDPQVGARRFPGWLVAPRPRRDQERRGGRAFALTPGLTAVLERQRALADAIERTTGRKLEWVFLRPDGRPIRYFRRVWITACEKAGLGRRILDDKGKLVKVVAYRIPHDFRRTAVRNLARTGIDRKTAMEMVGHKTESIYRRYTITDEVMLREASARRAALHQAERDKNSQSRAKAEEVLVARARGPAAPTSSASEFKLVAWDGIEPPTRGFSVRCSTN